MNGENEMITHEFTARQLAEGRVQVEVMDLTAPRNEFNPATYSSVRNIDGSNRLMRDGGGWSFLPADFEYAAGAALAAMRGKEYQYDRLVPAWARIV